MTSDLISRLRDDLFAAPFTTIAIDDLWGEDAAAALRRGQREPARRALVAAEGAGTLATLFILGLPVGARQLDDALPALGVAGAVALGLVVRDGDAVRPLVDLRPHAFVDALGPGSWWIASDLGEAALGHAIGENHVLGVGGASTTLAGLMLGTRVDTVLDLGTGCGIQALHAARHAKRVIATDISERALALARFNAELNGVTSIEFRLGSLYEPVAGERVDHIVSNPPFVITPRVEGVPEYEYRDGGLAGDDLVASVIAGAAAALVPGGVAQLLGNWEYRDGADAFDRLNEWLDGTGLDAWIVEREVQDAALYAETWIRDGGILPRTPEFDRLYTAWLDDFAARGATAVGFGYVTLRRPLAGEPTLRRLERLTGPLGHNAAGLGVHIAATLAAHDSVAGLDDAALAQATFAVAGDVTEERHYWPGDEHPTVMDLRQGGGFGRTFPLGTALAAVVGASDGELPIGAICSAVAQLLEVDESELLAEVLPSVRDLVVEGFLLVI
ncbi:methylase of polypeptide subunit release factors [Conyzicola lurida]|uniref:Methylase of polypeptide subunit release factors n=1 Tax=Conyzicola lurida TaxID=1172621 RepID=A0A841AMW8_9MICO|nr:methylase of polypeptide subunit release factors [Conyzicola lurida]